MAHRCTVCRSPRRERFEAMVLGGMAAAAAARALSLPADAGRRHMRLHLERHSPEPVVVAGGPDADPLETFRLAFGNEPMDHQAAYLRETRSLVVLKGRQVGMTEAAGALAIHTARARPGSLSAILSPSLRQSSYAAMRARLGLLALGEELRQDSASALRLGNGSLILSLPGTDTSVRGYAVDGVLVLDEAAWIKDLTWAAARATVIAAGGRVVVQSTPGEPQGFFHGLATDTPEGWARLVVRSDEVPTIDPEHLERERAEMDPVLFAQEYLAEFPDPEATVRGLFTREQLDAMTSEEPAYGPLRAIDQRGA